MVAAISVVVQIVAAAIAASAIFFGGAWLMSWATERQLVDAQIDGQTPLHKRWSGYDADAAGQYWALLFRDPAAVRSEQRFLEFDLVFPFIYGGAFAGCLLFAWVLARRPLNPALAVFPVALMMLADWTENVVQYQQLARFVAVNAGLPGTTASLERLQTHWITIASAATQIKLGSCYLVLVVLLWLTGLAVYRSVGHQPPVIAPNAFTNSMCAHLPHQPDA